MHATVVADRPMAKQKPGRPRKNPDMASIRIEAEVNDLAKEAAGIKKESVVAYATRVIRAAAEADILANAERRIAELKGKASKPKPE